MSLFGLEFKSREERERDERDYLYRIFPGGNDQRKAVEKELASRLPGVDSKGLLLYYILVRDAMTGRDPMSFEEASVRMEKKQRVIKITPKIIDVVRSVLEENG